MSGVPLFELGQVVGTPGALAALVKNNTTPLEMLARHVTLDPGYLDAHDQTANRQALRNDSRILSSYRLEDGTKLWIITEGDRSATTLLLPEEY
jgi:hypothetical protein